MNVSIGIYAAFLMFCNDWSAVGKDYAVGAWDNYFSRLHNRGFTQWSIFPYSIENRGIYNMWSPWAKLPNYSKVTHTDYDFIYELSVWDREYWKRLRKFLRIARNNGILIIPVGFGTYQEVPFKSNLNNVYGTFSMEARRYQKKYLLKLFRILKRIYGPKPLWFRLSNEVGHSGDWTYGIAITLQHEFWYETVKHYVNIENTICDKTKSDFACLEEPHVRAMVWYTDGKKELALMSRMAYDIIHLNPKVEYAYILDEWGKEKYGRKVWVEQHNMNQYTLNLPIEDGATMTWLERMTSCGWKKWVWSHDGNSFGNGYEVPGTGFQQLNNTELKVFLRQYAYAQDKIQVRFEYFPMEIFVRNEDGVLVEDMSKFKWQRARIPQAIWEEK